MVRQRNAHPDSVSQPHHKAIVQKTSHDLQASLLAFQRAQQVSAKRQRDVVQGVKLAVDADEQRPRCVHPPFSLVIITSTSYPVIQASRLRVRKNNVKRNYSNLSCHPTSLHIRSPSFKNEKSKFVRLRRAFMNWRKFFTT